MSLFPRIDKAMAGQPDRALTAVLLLVAAIAVLVALYAQPSVKAAVATWFVLP